MSRTKDEFLAAWADELTGLLLASFAEEKKHAFDPARDGRFFVQQLRRARDLLQRMWEVDVKSKEPLPVKPQANGTLDAPARPAVRGTP
jgi:hypothetical protein